MIRTNKCLLLLSLLCVPGFCHLALGQREQKPLDNSDRILSYHSKVEIRTSGELLVTEDITIFNGDGSSGKDAEGRMVYSSNNAIRKGIFRDFPTRYEDSTGYFTERGFHIRTVTRDGVKEPYATEDLQGGTRVKIGDKDHDLATGKFHYHIEYTTDRQLLFHEDKDELFWNVTGNGWDFTIDTATCEFDFPDAATILENACYTGAAGSKEHDCESQLLSPNVIRFHTRKRLEAREGISVAAAIQKGLITPPGKISNEWTFLRSNYIIPALSAILLFLFTFYYITWNRKGRDPKKGVVYPQFAPPENLSPADCGYVMDQKFTPHLFTAALIDCGVRKQLGIEVNREGLIFKSNVYHFVKPPEGSPVVDTNSMYGFNVQSLYGQEAKKGTYNSMLKVCSDALAACLKDRFEIGRPGAKNTGLFAVNKGYTQFGCLVIVLAIFLSVHFLTKHFSIPLAVITLVLLVLIGIVHNIFGRIMSAYTKKGREVVDHLLGFKMYLETTEQRVYQQLTPPEKTLDLFEKYLPYAIALQVENAWAEKFEGIMQKALEQGYVPAYYSMPGGHYNSFSMSDMSQGISSGFSSAISSASTPPSSSGGSGGGGSSGGGGGGGGGGGW